MFRPLLLLASLPVLSCQATYLDPSLHHQKPLVQGSSPETHSNPTILPLSLDANLSYTFPSLNNQPTSISRLQSTTAIHATHHEHHVISISIPLDDASHTGTVSFFSAPQQHSLATTTTSSAAHTALTWVSQNPWDADMHEIPLFSAGVRKGDMLSMSVESAVLDFGTPFITLPAGLWDVLVLATRPVLRPRGGGLGHRGDALMSVECAARSRFPDLVFGISGDNGEEELVVRPEQYVLQREGGECILLVKGAEERDEEDVVVGLGWAVGRGRQVVFDWEEGRIGLGELKG